MFARLRRSVSLALVATVTTSLGLAAPVVATHQGLCVGNQWPGGNTGQWYFERNNQANTFDAIYGWLTDRALFPCEGLGFGQGWSFAAAANIQSDDRGHNWIFQLGIIQVAGQGGDQNYFVRTASDGSGSAIIINNPRPSFGNRYQFRIYKAGDAQIHYQIRNAADNIIYSFDTGTSWDNDLQHAWWGYETANSESMPGIHKIDPVADLVGQYSYINNAAITTRTNIAPISACPTGCGDDWPNTQMNVSGGTNQIFNVETP